jgi:hypothetical protein
MTIEEIEARIRALNEMLTKLQSMPATKAGFLMQQEDNRKSGILPDRGVCYRSTERKRRQ